MASIRNQEPEYEHIAVKNLLNQLVSQLMSMSMLMSAHELSLSETVMFTQLMICVQKDPANQHIGRVLMNSEKPCRKMDFCLCFLKLRHLLCALPQNPTNRGFGAQALTVCNLKCSEKVCALND